MKQHLGKKSVLKIYIDSTDVYEDKALWEALLEKVKEFGLAGATVSKSVAGIGINSEVHTFDIWSLSQKLPLVIEIVDEKKRIEKFLDGVESMIDEAFVTLGKVEVLRYKNEKADF